MRYMILIFRLVAVALYALNENISKFSDLLSPISSDLNKYPFSLYAD